LRAQTTNLTISPATTADAATTANVYYVKVSNPCGGFIYSATNALTLRAPATLVWYGDGAANLWDVAVSTNWNYSAALGYPTNVFNFGDNVIFDDTSANTTVSLANPDLSPTLLTVNGSGSQNYKFTGSGALAGPGSFLMNSAGAVTIDVPNGQTGGMVISNGSVYFVAPTSLGYGAISLAGGGLIPPGTGLIQITNTINITGSNSTIAVNSPGGQPVVLTGPLNGLGGSLIFSNATAKAGTNNNIELAMAGFNLNLPVNLNIGSVVGGGLNILGENSSGTQTWSGVITGGGGMQRTVAGGATLLLNTNSYSGFTKLSNGSLGVGCDSASSSPPTIDYGPVGTGPFIIDSASSGPMALFAVGGPHNVGNPVTWSSSSPGAAFTVNGSNDLTLSGDMDLNDTNRVMEVDNTGSTIFSGVITDDGLGCGLTKNGTGALYLDGTNSYTGATTVGAGLLAGSGSLAGPAVVNSGASLGAGDAGAMPGTFTINSDATLNGNVFVRVNKALTQSNDLIAVTGLLTNSGSGTVTVANVGPALAVGDSFTIFSEAVSNGAALAITGAGMVWSNMLALNGSIQALSAAGPSVITVPPAIANFSLSGNNVIISGTNGQSGRTAYLLMTTNLAVPRNQWKTVATNSLGGNNYSFIGTNAVSAGSRQQFFMLSSTNSNP
jgi:autotransporter-associated beta strand protein